jgi:Alpha/beta hydrolase of unknown function (DUF900)/PhoD-like phosphatase
VINEFIGIFAVKNLEQQMKIVFTSCMDAVRVPDQPVWKAIQDQNPDVLMLLGDQIYMDWGLSLGIPNWKRRAETAHGLLRFAQEMHGRYSRQWAVAEFRKMIVWFMTSGIKGGASAPDRLFICWDDHDFAWNNACGADGDEDHSVPLVVRNVSRRLFNQFVAQLKQNFGSDAYPAFDEAYALTAPIHDVGVEQISNPAIGGIRIALLDERYYRVSRKNMDADNGVAQFLGPKQMQDLQTLLAQKPTLTVVGGGVPLAHQYLLSNSGWAARYPGEEDYPDLGMLLDAAKSPVLYLGGDIHKNEWGGLMKKANGQPSQVVQVSSSGAAIGRLLVWRKPPAFGIVNADVSSGAVDVTLCTLDENSVLQNPGPVKLTFGPEGWRNTAQIPPREHGLNQSHGVPSIMEITNKSDLAVVSFRARGPYSPNRGGEAERHRWDAMESLYVDSLPPGAGAAQPRAVLVSAQTQQVHIRRRVEGYDVALEEICAAAFRRAAGRPVNNGDAPGAVTFFVHGFNHGFADSIDQAFGLRDQYSDIEPILFTWPGGFSELSFLDLPYEFRSTLDRAYMVASGLYTALLHFKAARQKFEASSGKKIKSTLMVRSLGAQVLKYLLADRHDGKGEVSLAQNAAAEKLFDGFDAVILNSPAIDVEWHADALERLGNCPVYVSCNRNDGSLNKTHFFGFESLGSTLPTSGASRPARNATYLDCTDFDAIGEHHNYIFEPWNLQVIDAFRNVLHGPSQFQAPAGWANLGGQIWCKKP